MDVPQRLEYLINGFVRANYHQNKTRYLPYDIATLCIAYTGISKNNDYHLIKSNTELNIEADRRKEEVQQQTPVIKVYIRGAGAVGRTS